MLSTATPVMLVQDQDGSAGLFICGTNAGCVWDAVPTAVTVTIVTPLPLFVPGTTPRLQLPVRIAMMGGIFDANGSVPDLAGSADTLIDFE
jgi:hypothetical protein